MKKRNCSYAFRILLFLLLISLFTLGCQYTQPDSPQNNTPEEARVTDPDVIRVRNHSIDIMLPLVTRYQENGDLRIDGYETIDLGNGTLRELAILTFKDKETEDKFDEESQILLKESLGDDYNLICEDITNEGTPDTKATQLHNHLYRSDALHRIEQFRIRVLRHWSWGKHYLSLRAYELKENCNRVRLRITDSKGLTSGTGTRYNTKDYTVTTPKTTGLITYKSIFADFYDQLYIPGSICTYTRNYGSSARITYTGTYYSNVLQHLWYKTDIFTWNRNTSFPRFTELTGRLNQDKSAHIYATEIWKPAKNRIKNIVFITSGQQGAGSLSPDAFENVATGQLRGYDKTPGVNWEHVKYRNAYISGGSLAGKILSDTYKDGSKRFGFHSYDTYFAVVFDAAFYHLLSPEEKNRVVDAWLNWMLSAVGRENFSNIKNIYMAGTSRGGCLVTRMAYELNSKSTWDALDNAKIIVGSFDGVAKKTQGELFTTGYRKDNPLVSDASLFCWDTTLASKLTGSNIHILQVAGGFDFIGGPVALFSNVKAFHLDNTSRTQHIWVSLNHAQICRTWFNSVGNKHLQFLEDNLQ